jgi:hypothetical protein
VASRAVCSQCGKGWCAECFTSQGQVMICPPCDALCLPVAEQEAKEAKARVRARPLMDDLGTVLGYPLSDKTAFLLLAVFVGVFSVAASLAAFGAGLAILWKVLYSPVALVAGAISRGFLATLNPLAGIGAIIRMGGTYWSAMAIYTVIAVLETLIVAALSRIPMAGKFLGAFVQSYSYLAIGCLLGLAVFKRAPELGLD